MVMSPMQIACEHIIVLVKAHHAVFEFFGRRQAPSIIPFQLEPRVYIPLPSPPALAKVVKERKGKQEELRKNISIHTPHTHNTSRNLLGVASMGGFSGATGLAVYREEDDEELFETSSSISGDSDDEDQFSDGEEGAGALEHQFTQQSQQPVRRLNSDSLYDLSSMMAQLPVK